jgi:FMN-dependent NADH-azoreductase
MTMKSSKTLLQLNTSLHSERGQSSLLASQFARKWQESNPDGRVVIRDLALTPPPHLTAERFEAFLTAPEKRTPEQARHAAESDELIEELRSAAIVVIGLPMYNFGIPSALKAWIDHIVRAGETFKYTAAGPVGLLADRPVLLFHADSADQTQQIMLMKNLAIAGGFLFLAAHGAGKISLDRRLGWS